MTFLEPLLYYFWSSYILKKNSKKSFFVGYVGVANWSSEEESEYKYSECAYHLVVQNDAFSGIIVQGNRSAVCW